MAKNTDTHDENGRLKKGALLNPQGRPKGSTNKATAKVRKLIADLLVREMGDIQKDLAKMSPKDKWKVLTGLAKFGVPALASIKIDAMADVRTLIMMPEDERKRRIMELEQKVKGQISDADQQVEDEIEEAELIDD